MPSISARASALRIGSTLNSPATLRSSGARKSASKTTGRTAAFLFLRSSEAYRSVTHLNEAKGWAGADGGPGADGGAGADGVPGADGGAGADSGAGADGGAGA